MAEKITSLPAAKRTWNALRDIGYDINSAVADIIDNSLSRGNANNVYIKFKYSNDYRFYLYVFDDGIGMSASTLEESMRIGSNNDEYEKNDLSKYGMGLKTASLSQAMKLTVLSKTVDHEETCFSWDIHHINKSDKWEILKHNKDEIKQIKSALLTQSQENSNFLFDSKSWTLVLWDDLVEFNKNFNSYPTRNSGLSYYFRTIDSIKKYLRLVFGRFIVGENGAKQTNIYFNDEKLTSLDPFCRSEPNTLKLPLTETFGNFIINEDLPPIVINRYILPTNPSKPGEFTFSSLENWDEAKGTLSWNEAQGYYVYRNNRLISWGGWYRTKTIDEHDKLARASIDLSSDHDELFTLDIKKTRIQFPEELRNHLKDNVNSKFIAEAKRRYNGSEKKKNEVVNSVREKSKKVSHLASELVRQDEITVTKNLDESSLVITNKFGGKVTEDMTYKLLESGQKIISMPFGDEDNLFWRMVPNPYNEFQVLVNSNHPFYDKVYGDAEKDKKITAIMDAFLFTMSFIELKCITNNNELLFDQMKDVASSVLAKFIDEKII
jgi:hypothetical protein